MRLTQPVTLFKLFGFDIKADISWVFLSVLITWTLMNSIFPVQFPGYDLDTYQHMAVWSFFGLVLSIIVHEIAHAVIGEYYAMPILNIRLFIFGGVAEFKGQPSHPKGEFYMAFAGPIMSILIGLFFWATHIFLKSHFGITPLSQCFQYLGFINFVLAGFNLLPAFPLDGGRMLRAWLWGRTNDLVAATRTASNIGELFAYGLIGYGCYKLNTNDDIVAALWFGLLGIFMMGAGRYAITQTQSWSILSDQTVRDFMTIDFKPVTPDMSLSTFAKDYVYKFYQHSFPVIDQKKLIGIIHVQDMMQHDRKKWDWVYVSSTLRPLSENMVIDIDAPASEALDRFKREAVRHFMVTDKGTLVGMLSYNDMANYVGIIRKTGADL